MFCGGDGLKRRRTISNANNKNNDSTNSSSSSSNICRNADKDDDGSPIVFLSTRASFCPPIPIFLSLFHSNANC